MLAARELLAQAAEEASTSTGSCCRLRPAGPRPGLLAGLPPSIAVTGIVVARSADELRPSIARTAAELGRAVDAAIDLDETLIGDGYGRPTGAPGVRLVLAPDRGDPGRPDLHGQGARRARRRGPIQGAGTANGCVFWHAGGLPGLFEPLD